MIRDYLVFSWKNIKSKKLRSWLTLLGIFVGVAAVVALVGLGDALESAVVGQFATSTQLDVITVQAASTIGGPPGVGVINPLTDNIIRPIESIPGVKVVVPRIIEQVRMEFNDDQSVRFAGSIPDGEARDAVLEFLNYDLAEGRHLKDGDRNKVTLGYNYRFDTNVFDKAIQLGSKVTIEGEQFEVVGLFEKKGSFIFDNVINMNEDVLRNLIDNEDGIDAILVQASSEDLVTELEEDISQVLRKERDVDEGEEDFTVETPQAALSSLQDVLQGVQIFISVVAAISILVGSIGIVNTMLTSVLERRSQIGIMKAIGARNRDIFFQFFIESGIMGLMGGVIGAIIGSIIAFVGTNSINSFLGATAEPSIDFVFILLVCLGSFAVGALAGVIPAYRAAQEQPVEALSS